jgi:solute carrier family 35 protein E3
MSSNVSSSPPLITTPSGDEQQQNQDLLSLSPSDIKIALLILGNIVSSVSIILVNKTIMNKFHFPFAIVLTMCHFGFSAFCLELAAFFQLFETKRIHWKQSIIYGTLNVFAICFMNYSLQTNSVSVYQMIKLLCIPCTVLFEYCWFNQSFSKEIVGSLIAIFTGVSIVVFTDVELNSMGSLYGMIAILSSSLAQIFIGRGHQLCEVNSLQMLHSLFIPQTLLTFFMCLPTEILPNQEILLSKLLASAPLVSLVIGSCVISVLTNYFAVSSVAATSAVTVQVVGHAKTCFILAMGVIIFPKKDYPLLGHVKDTVGVVVGMCGVVLYTYFKKRKNSTTTTTTATTATTT